ncbi:MAG: acyltransferase domain-containing protein, partial [Gammaproteobacteria bacterium]|nr:acyltransferase domain-containing protein [Gammaproteobacteria bacterium]
DIFMYMCFSKTPALSPTGASRPFSSDGDGTILGEGLGIVVLKRLSDAERDGDRIYAVIRGVGAASDGQGSAIYAPQTRGQAKAMRAAYERAGITPDTIELLEAHGTGTRVGDAVELESVSSVFAEHGRDGAPWCALGSVKSMIGHTKAAAGAAGLIKIALALEHKVLPPTINVDTPLPEALLPESPVYLNTETRPWIGTERHPRRAAVSAFGFGGSNFHCVLEEYRKEKQVPDWNGETLLFPLGADSREGLRSELSTLTELAAYSAPRALSARARLRFDHRSPFRLVFPYAGESGDFEDWVKKLLRLFDASEEKSRFQTPEGAVYGQGEPPGRLCALFPGQGSQYVGMLRDLVCQFPEVLSTLEQANRAHGSDRHGERLSDRIYPLPVFDDDARALNEASLRDTRVAQPAIGALSLGALKLLRRFGIEFDAAAGHSFGELTALCAAGRISDDDFLKLATARGAIMADLDGDRGAMLAVAASVEAVQSLIEAEQLDQVIANRNAPAQIVLSGAAGEVDKALSACDAKDIRARRLPVSAAFHSALVADAQRPFHDALKQVEFRAGRFPVHANTSGEEYPDDVNEAKALLSGQLANPVDFVEEIENLHAAGVRTFIEVGPSNKLSGLVSSILGSKDHHALALDASGGARSGEFDLAGLLARVVALGYPVDLEPFDQAANPLAHQDFRKQEKLTVPLTGANYMKERPKPKTEPAPEPARSMPAEAPSAPPRPAAPSVAAKPVVTPVDPGPPTPLPADAEDSLRITQENILALQQLQQQTAELHRRYLETQETSQRTIERLMEQQARLLGITTATDTVPVAPSMPNRQETTSSGPSFEPPTPPAPAQPPPPVDRIAAAQSAEAPPPSRETGDILMQVVADKTGYPLDMLSLDMSLDADLGIDSIKRVEILSSLAEALPDGAEVNPEDIARFRTLADVVAFLETGDGKVPVTEPRDAAPAATPDAAMIIEVVAEKTGYPVDMLSLDMELDADLGIDSIKRVEILSVLQERLEAAPEVPPDAMSRFRTLADVADFLCPRSTPVEPASGAAPPESYTEASALIGIVAEKTGYPADMLSLDMELDADLGIDSIKRVEILSAISERVDGASEIDATTIGELRTLADVLERTFDQGVSPKPAAARATDHDAPPRSADPPRIERKVLVADVYRNASTADVPLSSGGRIWITDDGGGLAPAIRDALAKIRAPRAEVVPLDVAEPPADLAGLILVSPRDAGPEFVPSAFDLLKKAAGPLRGAADGGGALVAGITRVNGAFGLNGGPIANPWSAGIGGLVKCAAREWPRVHARVIDAAENAPDLHHRIADLLLKPGPLEIGITLNECVELSLRDTVGVGETGNPPFESDDLIVVTGGARGVTAEVAAAIAERCRSSFLLLGRSPVPAQEPAWLRELERPADLRTALLERRREKSVMPAEIEREVDRVIQGRQIRRTLERIKAAGGAVLYRSVDVRSRSQVASACNEARREFGPVRGVIHGAGVLADKLIED